MSYKSLANRRAVLRAPRPGPHLFIRKETPAARWEAVEAEEAGHGPGASLAIGQLIAKPSGGVTKRPLRIFFVAALAGIGHASLQGQARIRDGEAMIAPRMAGLTWSHSVSSALVTVTKSLPRNTPAIPGTRKIRAARGEASGGASPDSPCSPDSPLLSLAHGRSPLLCCLSVLFRSLKRSRSRIALSPVGFALGWRSEEAYANSLRD